MTKLQGMTLRWVAAGVLLAATAGQAGATVITALPVDFLANEGSVYSDAVATFTDDNPDAVPGDFTASIDWGDGSSPTAGTIVTSSAAFTVLGSHTYADEGAFTATVTIADNPPGTGTATVTDAATVNESDVLSGTPVTFSAPSGVSFTTTVANFSDTLASAVPGDFTATINWGDAMTSAGTVSGSGGSFQVSGTHTYAGSGTFSVVVTLSDDAPGTATAEVTSTAHVASGLSVLVNSFSVAEGTAFNGTVATFSDADTTKTAASFNTSINWGDATPATPGTVTGGSGSFTLTGQHTYADEGTFTVSVMVAENPPGTAKASGTGTATVTEADALAGTAVAINAQMGVPFSGAVATFTDSNTANTASDFTATIDWGDATTTPGTVTGGGGSFTVSGTHTYATKGSFPVTVTLTDDAPGTATATANSTANVTAFVAAVPALSFYGLLALGLCLGFFALRRLRTQT